MKRLSAVFLAITYLLLTPFTAYATSIVSTSPTAGSILSISPTAITIKANADLLDGANEITVTDAKGVRVDDGSIQIQGAVLMVGVKPLTTSGLYTVAYTLMAIDQPPIVGTFTFLYNSPAEMVLPTPTPTDTQVATPTANRSTDIFVIGLMVFAFIMLIFLSRYAKKTFNSPSTSGRRVKKVSTSKKFIK
jgi:methionine-rich copper-binding protein CopC